MFYFLILSLLSHSSIQKNKNIILPPLVHVYPFIFIVVGFFYVIKNMFNRPIKNGMPRFHWNAGSLYSILFVICYLFSPLNTSPCSLRLFTYKHFFVLFCSGKKCFNNIFCLCLPSVASQLTIIVFLVLFYCAVL